MAITVAEALQAGRDKLGVKSGDPEFSPAKLLDALNDTLGELHQDLQGINADLLEVSATLTADSTESRVFSLASQTPPILNVFAPRQLTLTDADGVAFDRRDRVRLDQYGGRGYALMGLPGAQRIELARDNGGGLTLFFRYLEGLPLVAANGTVPLWVPDRFKVLLGLMIASQCFSQGGESAFPRDQAELLQQKKGELWDYWAGLAGPGLMRPDASEGLAPYLF